MKINLQELATITQGKIISDPVKDFSDWGTDTRKNLNNSLFIALGGPAYDAHNFISQAVKSGATGILVHEWRNEWNEFKNKVSFLQVADTLEALQKWANLYRKKNAPKVVGITGSNGKTSTREFIYQLLQSEFRVHNGESSLNNHWGVPFTLLKMPQDTQIALVEMGMNHAGEIKKLVEIAEPDLVLCTMVGSAHIENFGSQQGIADAKEEIYRFAGKNSQKIFNLDNEFTRKMFQKYPGANFTFSAEDAKALVHLKIISSGPEGLKIKGHLGKISGECLIPVWGEQNLTNIMAAACVALALNVPAEKIWQNFAKCRTIWGRNQIVHLKSGATALFDAYNSNPESMKALLKNTLKVSAPKKIGLFGQMRELGKKSAELHQEIGHEVGLGGFAKIYFFGEDAESFAKGLQTSGCKAELLTQSEFSSAEFQKFLGGLHSGEWLVIKGSRGQQMERLMPFLEPLDF